ncbi:hypothetical protein BDM02DRAFT_3188001 [Thelephora ganbajun]|uniref:Uncharacterized protein n=1 Tax=Thelephora ganbajun TaxID=370292 RepID=A0ACB6ZCZ2_THEGA|nr:hypothetical protein BDM02DRAFT_3188001 [Thelephora ganbajun]
METQLSEVREKIDLTLLQRLFRLSLDHNSADYIAAKNTVSTYKDMARTNACGLIGGLRFSAPFCSTTVSPRISSSPVSATAILPRKSLIQRYLSPNQRSLQGQSTLEVSLIEILRAHLWQKVFHENVVMGFCRMFDQELELLQIETAEGNDPPSYIFESDVLVFSDYVYEDVVYAETYVRHWNIYRGPKHRSLFSVYVVGIEGQNQKEVASGKRCATHSPAFSNDGTKFAWAELVEDGCESDRAILVNRSPVSLSVPLFHSRKRGSCQGLRPPGSNQELASPSNPYLVAIPCILRVLSRSPTTSTSFVDSINSLLHAILGIMTQRIRIVTSRGPQGAWEDGWLAGWNAGAFAQLGYFVVAVPHLVRLPLDKTSRMPSRKVGEESRVSISEEDGNISSMTIFWCGPWPLELSCVLASPPQVDSDRTAAAGANYGGYAIRYFFALIPRDRDKDVSISWILDRRALLREPLTRFDGGLVGELTKKFVVQPIESRSQTAYSRVNHPWEQGLSSPRDNGIGAFHILQQRVPGRLVIFSDENHQILNHGNSLKWHYNVFRWLNHMQYAAFSNCCTRNSEYGKFSQTEDLDDEVAGPLSKL